MPVPSPGLDKKRNPPCRLCPHAMGNARPTRAPSTSLHRGDPCTSRQAVHAAACWRCGEDTPEMERTVGPDPGVRTVGSQCRFQCSAGPHGKFLMSGTRQRDHCRVDGAACRPVENKEARNLAVSGPLRKRAWEVRAYATSPPGSHGSRWSCAHKCAARHGSVRKAEHKATRTSARPGAGRLLMGVAAAFTFSPGEKVNRWKWEAVATAMELTVKSLYLAVNSCLENFLCLGQCGSPARHDGGPPRAQGSGSPQNMPAAYGNPEVPGQVYWMANALAAPSLRGLEPRQLLANEFVAPAIALRDDGTPPGSDRQRDGGSRKGP